MMRMTSMHKTEAISTQRSISKRRGKMYQGGDMIVGLYNLPAINCEEIIKIKRAFVGDKEAI